MQQELIDQFFVAIESGDNETVRELVNLHPHLKETKAGNFSPLDFAALHGHSQILKILDFPKQEGTLKDLYCTAAKYGHKETLVVIMQAYAQLFEYNNKEAKNYQDLHMLAPPNAKGLVMFPYHWNKIKGLMIAHHRGKLGQRVPIKKVAKYLW